MTNTIWKAWVKFILIEFLCLIAAAVGLFLLLYPSLTKQWRLTPQLFQPDWAKELDLPLKNIYIWNEKWNWLNPIWGNDEDGVATGYIFGIKYNPELNIFKAYYWCALRNSCNNLRFKFRWIGGPFYRWNSANGKWYFQAGWNSSGFPVLSAGRL